MLDDTYYSTQNLSKTQLIIHFPNPQQFSSLPNFNQFRNKKRIREIMATEKSVMAVIRASRPSFRNNYDKVAFAVHSSFLATGFSLVVTGPPAFADNLLSSSSSYPSDEVGIEGWNDVEDDYAFLYVNPEKGNKKVLVKCLVMGDKLMVDGLSEGASEPVHLEINVDEFVAVSGASDYNAQFRNLGKLVSKLESEVLSKLDGGSAGSHLSVPSRSRPSEELRNIDGSGSSHHYPTGYVLPPVNPIGGSDLLPSGGAGIYPSRGDFGGGSMLVGPEDPRWFGGGGAFSGISGGPGGLGGPPPGARFDAYGPPGVPGFQPGHFGRFPRGPSPGSGTHPDLQPGWGGPGRRIHPDLEQPGSGGFDDYI